MIYNQKKASSCIKFTNDGIIICVTDEHLTIPFSIDSKKDGRRIRVDDVQYLKAKAPIKVTESGIERLLMHSSSKFSYINLANFHIKLITNNPIKIINNFSIKSVKINSLQLTPQFFKVKSIYSSILKPR